MNNRIAILLLAGLGFAVGPAQPAGSRLVPEGAGDAEIRPGVGDEAPSADTPRSLTLAWLQIHQRELCLGLEVEFKFKGEGVEISCRIDDEKSYEKMMEKFEPLRAVHRVVVYPTRSVPQKDSLEEKEPPPSLWNNGELRIYLQDHSARDLTEQETATWGSSRGEREISLKTRMILFADQVLEWDKKLRRYAVDLPALVFTAMNPSVPRDLRIGAATICQTHLLGMEKNAEKLEQNLERALPRASKSAGLPAEKLKGAGDFPVEEVDRVSLAAQEVARRADNFIYPQQHTVALADLKEPYLLDSLASLRKMIHDLQDSLRKKLPQASE